MAGKHRKRRRLNWLHELAGLALWVLGILLAMSLASYHPRDLSWFGGNDELEAAHNLAGPVGATLAELLYQLLGRVGWILPPLLLVAGWSRIRPPREEPARKTTLLGGIFLILGACTFAALVYPRFQVEGEWLPTGGLIGERVAAFLEAHLNRPGAIVLSLTVVVGSLTLAAQLSLLRLAHALHAFAGAAARRLLVLWSRAQEARRKRRMREAVLQKQASRRQASAEAAVLEADQERAEGVALPAVRARLKPHIQRTAETFPTPAPASPGTFTLPPLSLLNPPPSENPVDDKELVAKARLLAEKFLEFDVRGSVVQIHPGPVVTTFEFKPEAGVKFSKMLNLVDDLALALKAESVRIARIPGHSTIGIEVPNRIREVIHLREMLASEAFTRSQSKLTIGLGKRIDGEVYVTDLARMPHLLIAGATGTGKSVALNSIISSILFRATPSEVRFTMIDTKRLELGMYEEIPHLLTPVVVEPRHAANALRWTTTEMERRYRQLAEVGVRSIDQYNALLRNPRGRRPASVGEAPEPLPYLVVVIDEFADLMLASAREVEESITRLAQMARAVGIHLILSTQRPSVDIITGIIKANFSSRIAFHVSSKVDSRTIIDGGGAEKLLGMGDMLFMPPGTSRLIRLHGPLIVEAESRRLVDFLKRQARPTFDPNVVRDPEESRSTAGARGLEHDPLYDEAARLVVAAGQASVSHLQRRLRLGYARAARVMDQLEADGIVGPADGSKMRQVLVDADFLESIAQREGDL
ncbi:MAG: DNA translocase FtsK 4TM domain-containing protein [Acidobacteriota bacterium]